MTRITRRTAGHSAAGLLLGLGLGSSMGGRAMAQAAAPVRIALGDVVSVETLATLVALERAKDRGVPYVLTSFAKEELAIQSIVNGQMDLGIGSPYALIQRARVPLRNLFQLSRLIFFPVVTKEWRSWKDVNGQPFAFHARGTGTEAIGNIIAEREGIQFGARSYVPGSENRIIALMQGQIKGTIVDLSNKNKLMAMPGAADRFHVLPGVDQPASDELLFGNQDWITKNPTQVAVVIEEMLRTWRELVADPASMERERAKRGLLADQPKEILADTVPFYTEGVANNLFDRNGGGEAAAKVDFDFFTRAGQLKGNVADLKLEEFWDLRPLNAALLKVGA